VSQARCKWRGLTWRRVDVAVGGSGVVASLSSGGAPAMVHLSDVVLQLEGRKGGELHIGPRTRKKAACGGGCHLEQGEAAALRPISTRFHRTPGSGPDNRH
jgi:hypothetical protein